MEVIKADDGQNSDCIDDSGEIVSALLHAAAFVRARFGEFLQRYELTEGRFAVLAALHGAGAQGLSQSEVADQLLQSESNVSSLIERLHRDGLVDRRWSDTDRRKRVLLLTEDATRLFPLIEAGRRRWARALLSNVGTPDRQALTAGLRALASTVTEPHSRVASLGVPIHSAAPANEIWSDRNTFTGRDPASPHFALEQMLSTLGLASRFAEDE